MLTDRITRALLGLIVVALIANLALGLRTPATAQEDEPAVGKYQVAAPDLITDTTTGSIVDAKGKTIAPPVSPKPKPVGTYQTAGWVTVATKVAAWDAFGRPQVVSEERRSFATVDTTTGKIAASKTYSRRPVVSGGAPASPAS